MEQNDLIDLRRFVNRSPDTAFRKLAVAFKNAIQSVEKSITELKQIKSVLTQAEFDELLENIEVELSMSKEDVKEENVVKITKVKEAFGKK
jgi:hypothetical protein